MKRYKKEQNGKLEIGQVLYTKHFALTVDRQRCKGCELCKLVCPREAITLIPAGDANGKAVAPLVDIDESKCDFHGICAVVCPFSAISITANGQNSVPAVSREVFPTLSRDIVAHQEQCPPGCKACADACPQGIVSVQCEPGGAGTQVEIDKERCAGCQNCWIACPADAIAVTKFIEGSVSIEPKNCPDDCHRCLDVCPVSALAVGVDGKVCAKDMHCIYCGACLQVCPAEGALKVERTAIRHTPVHSGAWNKGLERLTSTTGLMRELAAERAEKMRGAVQRLGNSEGNE